MSCTDEIDESISELLQYDSLKPYVVIASTKVLGDTYVVFEPNYRFTKFDNIKLLSFSTNDQRVYLYKLRLPCAFNPFIYIFFDEVQVDGVHMMGDPNTDSHICIIRSCVDYRHSNVKQIISDDDLKDVTYKMTDTGELYVNELFETENEFCLKKYNAWYKNQYNPFYYFNDKDPNIQIKIVYRNEEVEFTITEYCEIYSKNSLPHHTIYDFTEHMVQYFLSLFCISWEDTGENKNTADSVRTIYKLCFQHMTPWEIFDTIGNVIALINGNIHDIVLDEHHIVIVDVNTGQKRIFKTIEQSDLALFSVRFYPTRITVYWNRDITLELKTEKFRYEFILPPKCNGCESFN